MGCPFLLQGIFPTQGSNPHLLHLLLWLVDSLQQHYLGSPGQVLARRQILIEQLRVTQLFYTTGLYALDTRHEGGSIIVMS